MRIISKERDYYDSAQGLGIDETLVYVRHPRKIKLDEFECKFIKDLFSCAPRWSSNRWRYDKSEIKLTAEPFIIGFCGRVFPGMELKIRIGKDIFGDAKYKMIYVYSYKKLIEILGKYKLESKLKEVRDKTSLWGTNKKSTMEFFKLGKRSKEFEKFFIGNKAPVFTVVQHMKLQIGLTPSDHSTMKHPDLVNGGLIINNNLKDLHFFEKIDAFTAYQEISMYMGGVIPRNTPELVEVSDKSMIKKKGFNECSFRKMPDNRKRKLKAGKLKKKR